MAYLVFENYALRSNSLRLAPPLQARCGQVRSCVSSTAGSRRYCNSDNFDDSPSASSPSPRTMECVVFAQLRSMAPSAVRKLWSLLGTPLAACEAGRR
eukprot:s4577_g2.t1